MKNRRVKEGINAVKSPLTFKTIELNTKNVNTKTQADSASAAVKEAKQSHRYPHKVVSKNNSSVLRRVERNGSNPCWRHHTQHQKVCYWLWVWLLTCVSLHFINEIKGKAKKRVSRLWVLFYSTLDFSVPCLLSLKKSQKKEEHNTKLKNSSFWRTDSVM